MQYSINVLNEELKKEENNLFIIPENRKELRDITYIKIEDLQAGITCLELVKNKINPFTNGAFCNLKNKRK